MNQPFTELEVLSVFYFGGTKWVKQSSRTAHIYGSPAIWYYFGKNERVRKESR